MFRIPHFPHIDTVTPYDGDHDAAPIVASHHEQGWVRLANGTIVFDDTGEILADGTIIAPHRNDVRLVVAA